LVWRKNRAISARDAYFIILIFKQVNAGGGFDQFRNTAQEFSLLRPLRESSRIGK